VPRNSSGTAGDRTDTEDGLGGIYEGKNIFGGFIGGLEDRGPKVAGDVYNGRTFLRGVGEKRERIGDFVFIL